MGISNLRVCLESKFADWIGEQRDITKPIDEITAAYETLGEKRERLEKIELLAVSATNIVAQRLRTASKRDCRF